MTQSGQTFDSGADANRPYSQMESSQQLINEILSMSSRMLDLMQDGLTYDVAQKICAMLLPHTDAVVVSITDREVILGYAGIDEDDVPPGTRIRTQATADVVRSGTNEVLLSAEEIGFPTQPYGINAAIIVPLFQGQTTFGTLKFYFRDAKDITGVQQSIASGFGGLLSTQLAAVEMENQRKLATAMELKMLQSQINPHFLFNTINTIASLIRTDPPKARVLLRDFALFYRRTLEDSSERILLSRELEQIMRYFSFIVARFGDERVALTVNAAPEVQDMLVPPFIIQPIVENAVQHAMPPEGLLTITILAETEGRDIVVQVIDDGVGMSEEARQNILHPVSKRGMGIAVKNVNDRIRGFFGPDASLQIESTLGEGTTVVIRFPECAGRPSFFEDGDLQ